MKLFYVFNLHESMCAYITSFGTKREAEKFADAERGKRNLNCTYVVAEAKTVYQGEGPCPHTRKKKKE